jgi:hypothetical protein
LTTKRSFSLPGRDNVLGVAIKCDIASSSPLLMDSEGGDNTSADPGEGDKDAILQGETKLVDDVDCASEGK